MPANGLGLPVRSGTYALLLDVPARATIGVGGLGPIPFEAGIHLYAGSAFGPGGLAARLGHHLAATARPHWHVDHLRRVAAIACIWTTTDPRRMECAWSQAARALRGARAVPGFGASDCRCASHLVWLPRPPSRAAFRRHLADLVPPCAPIRVHTITGYARADCGLAPGRAAPGVG